MIKYYSLPSKVDDDSRQAIKRVYTASRNKYTCYLRTSQIGVSLATIATTQTIDWEDSIMLRLNANDSLSFRLPRRVASSFTPRTTLN
eukprot:scaffold3910_cov182-Amphora_coffeaeformis.AAC.1